MSFDATAETCVCMPGATKAANDANVCCSPNQVLALRDGAWTCTGTPSCPPNYTRIDALQTCAPTFDFVATGNGGCNAGATNVSPWVPDDVAMALGLPRRNSVTYVFNDQWRAFFARYLLPTNSVFKDAKETPTQTWIELVQPTLSRYGYSLYFQGVNACCKSMP